MTAKHTKYCSFRSTGFWTSPTV